MDITMIGLQNAGKTSLLRVLAVSIYPFGTGPCNVALNSRALDTDETRAASLPSSASKPALLRDGCIHLRRSLRQFCTDQLCVQLDSHRGVQHEASPEGPCDPEVVCIAGIFP